MESLPKSHFPIQDCIVFFKRFIAKPGQIGSVMPSSRYLVKNMLSHTDWSKINNVAELGAGTGVVTSRLLTKLRSHDLLSVFELDKKLRAELESSLKISIYADARDLERIFKPNSLDVIVSSLPWTTLPKQTSLEILRGILKCLRPDGQLIAFQYSWQMYHVFRRLFQSVKISFVLRNVPPAFVYNCQMPLKIRKNELFQLFPKNNNVDNKAKKKNL